MLDPLRGVPVCYESGKGPAMPSDQEEFSTAVRLLRQCVETGDRLPLHYTLPSGSSIEALCDRLYGTSGSVPNNVGEAVRYLARRFAITLPNKINYHTYSVVLREIALRLTLPFDQRQVPLTKEGRLRPANQPIIRISGLKD
jgi:hypothetical protein